VHSQTLIFLARRLGRLGTSLKISHGLVEDLAADWKPKEDLRYPSIFDAFAA
jgi:hypothetical protein